MMDNRKRQKNPMKGKRKGNCVSNTKKDYKSDRISVDERESMGDAHTSTPNDWRWYAQNAQLIKDYASYPFGVPVGNRLNVGIPTIDAGSIPGLMALYFIPRIGVANSENDPINIAMRRMYSFVRHANSGSANYDAPDLMIYMLSVDGALMYHAYLKRLYAVMMDYTAFNRYYPRALVEANMVDFTDLEANLVQLRGYINQYAVKLSQLWVPNSMSYMARHVWMCEGMYTDSVSAKAQTYMYVPFKFFKFALDSQGVGSVTYASPWDFAGQRVRVADLISFGNELLNPMISNEDFGIMSGDILKAFGASGIISVQGISEGYQVVPMYSREVLSQIENSTILGATPTPAITQQTAVGTGYLTQDNTFNYGVTATGIQASTATNVADAAHAPLMAKHMLNFHDQAPTPEEVMVATRLTQIAGPATNVAYSNGRVTWDAKVETLGSEYVGLGAIFTYVYNTSGTVELQSDFFQTNMIYSMNTSSTNNNVAKITSSITRFLARLSTFDWHPQITVHVLCNNDGDMTWSDPQGRFMDVDFYTLLDSNNLANMSLTAILSELTIPQIS